MTFRTVKTSTAFSDRKIMGMPVVTATIRDQVIETRRVRAPDGTILICRRRRGSADKDYWTAEIPLEIAADIYMND
jgi:hypothetical protein